MSTSTKRATTGTVIPNWVERIAGESDPTDREIVAYKLGKEDRKAEELSDRKQLFETNLELCCYYSSKFHDFITNDKKINCELATIKAETINRFHSLFVIELNDYKSKELRGDLFKLANEFRSALRTKDICLEFSITPKTEHLDITEISNDGFFWHYESSVK